MLRFCDGFDAHSVIGDLSNKWNVASGTFLPTGGRFGGGAIRQTTNVSTEFRKFFDVEMVDTCIGFSFKKNGLFAAETTIMYMGNAGMVFTDGTSVANYAVRIDTAGRLGIRHDTKNANANATFMTTTNICDNAWHWVEFRINFVSTGANSTVTIQIDGVTEYTSAVADLTETGVAIGIGRVALMSASAVTWDMDDFIAYDDVAGVSSDLRSSVNFPLGPRRIETLRPTGAGTTTQWTPSAGANYECVDDTAPDGDTTYNLAATSGLIDLYAMGNLSSSPTNIKALVVNVHGRRGDAELSSIYARTKSAAAQADSSALPLGVSYGTKQVNVPLDPNTSALWTGAAVDAAEFGVKTV